MSISDPTAPHEHLNALRQAVDAVVFDIDGVLEYRGQVYPGATDLVAHLKRLLIPVRILSNSTLKSRRSCTAKLRQKGFGVEEDEVFTASYATAVYLRTLNPRSCWIMLDGDGLEEFAEFIQTRDNPEYVVVGDYRNKFNFRNLNLALGCLNRGAGPIVMITEQVDGSLGHLELTVGAYGRMLEVAAGIRATWIGKPQRYMFDLALQSLPGLPPERVLMVGDKVITDIAGARKAGMRSALVRTGEFRPTDLGHPAVPDVVIDSVADLQTLFA